MSLSLNMYQSPTCVSLCAWTWWVCVVSALLIICIKKNHVGGSESGPDRHRVLFNEISAWIPRKEIVSGQRRTCVLGTRLVCRQHMNNTHYKKKLNCDVLNMHPRCSANSCPQPMLSLHQCSCDWLNIPGQHQYSMHISHRCHIGSLSMCSHAGQCLCTHVSVQVLTHFDRRLCLR